MFAKSGKTKGMALHCYIGFVKFLFGSLFAKLSFLWYPAIRL